MGSENKDLWYAGNCLKSEVEKKFCRCLLEQAAKDLERNKKFTTNSYAICTFSLSRNNYNLRPRLNRVARSGACTKCVDFESLPTRLLYTYVALRYNTAKGKSIFKDLSMPTPAVFFKKPEEYRTELLQAANKYKEKAEAHGSSSSTKKKSRTTKNTASTRKKSTSRKSTTKGKAKKKKSTTTTKKKKVKGRY